MTNSTDTQPHLTPPPAESAPPPQAAPPPPPQAGPPPPSPPPPAQTEWRPPQADHGRNASRIFGIILLGIGLWFFATETLGLDLPELDWAQLWPIFLIGLGAWVVLGSMNRRR
jgi:Domain of unknown function (DUF5668)